MQSWYYMRVRFVLALTMVMATGALAQAQAEDAGDDAALEMEAEAELDDDADDTMGADELDDEDDGLMEDEGDSLDGPPPSQTTMLEEQPEAVEPPSPFSGKVTIAINGGIGLQVAGDRSVDPFRIGADQQELLDDAMPPDISTLSLFTIAREVQDSYRTSLPEPPQPSPFGVGFGGRLGISLPEDPLYLGVSFAYFAGGSETLSGGPVSSAGMMVTQPQISTTLGLMMFGGEGGLEWAPVDFFVIRPSIGVGIGMASSEVCLAGSSWVDFQGVTHTLQAGCEAASSTHYYISAGIEGLVPLTDLFYIGGEGRFLALSGEGGAVAFYLGATGGVTLDLF